MTKINLDFELEDLPADAAGELLMLTLNKEERWGYWTRDFDNNNWSSLDAEHMTLEMRTHMLGCYAKSHEEIKRIDFFANYSMQISMGLYWDSDGVIVFAFPNNLFLVNNDMKKDYNWKWEGESSWVKDVLKDHTYYDV